MWKRTAIVTRLVIGFSLILIGALVLGFMGARSITHLSAITSDLLRHPFAVTSASLNIRSDALFMQRMTRDFLLQKMGHEFADRKRKSEVGSAQKRVAAMKVRVDKNMETVRQRTLIDPAFVTRADRALTDWYASVEETFALANNGRHAEAMAQNEGRDSELLDAALNGVKDISDFAANKAAELERISVKEQTEAQSAIALMLALILTGGALVAFVVILSVKQSLKVAVDTVRTLIADSNDKVLAAQAVGAGDLTREIVISKPLEIQLDRLPKDELGLLMRTASRLSKVQSAFDEAFLHMTRSLRLAREKEAARDWLKSGRNELNLVLGEEHDTAAIANRVLGFLVNYLKAGVGALYLFDERTVALTRTATYAVTGDMQPGKQFRLGEGVIGQAAREQKIICLDNVPPGYLPIGSALGTSIPNVLIAIPLLHGNRLVGVIEIGTFHNFSANELKFLEIARETIAIAIDANLAHQRTAELLEQTEQQTEELRVQQEELQQSNEELEERAQMLEQQRESIRLKSHEIEAASQILRDKVEELDRVSTYKSEFLANMSHELRTPLNSLMILSSLLKQNKEGNLTDKQVSFAATINSAGTDLLNLINDILDLSKVEAGQMQFNFAALSVTELCDSVRATFEAQAEQKGLAFRVETDNAIPATFGGDEQRVHQILKNLLSNALKFSEKGEVSLRVTTPSTGENPLAVPAIAFVVSDTGIGISAAKQHLVFEAFQQADGSISRKYGGTGLGLSISRELAHKMHGEILLTSKEGQGSVFTLYMPLSAPASADQESAAAAPRAPARASPLPAPLPKAQEDDTPPWPVPENLNRRRSDASERCILIIEDDANFAGILQTMVEERGFEALVAADGESGIAMARRFLPSAIVLDVMLPHIDGWGVMRSLKDNARTRHIPVHFVTCMEDRQKAMAMGAIGFATKPVSMEELNGVFQSIEGSLAKSVRKLLIVEDNGDEAKSMVALLEEGGVEIAVAASGKAAIELLSSQSFDCLVLDLGLSDMSGFELLEYIQNLEGARRIPVIIHSGRELSHEDERKLRRYAESIIIKGVKSPERLLNEVTLFLHLVESNLHPNKQRMIRTAIDKEAMLEGRKVLLVDDDMRNVFSLTSLLAEKNMVVIEAENGKEAIARLEEHDDIGIVLMDIMMPEMDGYAAMREIRKNPRLANIPIIAMTAKALRGDQEKCMAAGASDYISKPIEVEKLLSLIRVWIFQHV